MRREFIFLLKKTATLFPLDLGSKNIFDGGPEFYWIDTWGAGHIIIWYCIWSEVMFSLQQWGWLRIFFLSLKSFGIQSRASLDGLMGWIWPAGRQLMITELYSNWNLYWILSLLSVLHCVFHKVPQLDLFH